MILLFYNMRQNMSNFFIHFFIFYSFEDTISKKVLISISKLIISGSPNLCGDVRISGSKNSALPIMAACIMIRGKVIIKNVPYISDVLNMSKILTELGCQCEYDNDTMEIDSSKITKSSGCIFSTSFNRGLPMFPPIWQR